MAGLRSKKRKVEDGMQGKMPESRKKFKMQTAYRSDSSSSDEAEEPGTDFKPVDLNGSDEEPDKIPTPEDPSGEDEASSIGTDTDAENASDIDGDGSISESDSNLQSKAKLKKKRKRNDPDAFATSISKILSSKLSTSKRGDPVLSRSTVAITASQDISEARLEARAKHKLREERRAALDKGRERDVLGISRLDETGTAAENMELERRLKKTAQRGVVKLFNAVRAAQVRGEEAAREARKEGIVGMKRREKKVTEMTKRGFLDLVAGDGPERGAMESSGLMEA
jgi:hypothetical protein